MTNISTNNELRNETMNLNNHATSRLRSATRSHHFEVKPRALHHDRLIS